MSWKYEWVSADGSPAHNSNLLFQKTATTIPTQYLLALTLALTFPFLKHFKLLLSLTWMIAMFLANMELEKYFKISWKKMKWCRGEKHKSTTKTSERQHTWGSLQTRDLRYRQSPDMPLFKEIEMTLLYLIFFF